jgi:hypothetical protein
MDHGGMKARGPLGEEDKRRLVLKLVARLRCPECGQSYDSHDFILVDRQPDAWVLGVQCHQCGASSHILIVMDLRSKAEPVADLSPEERRIVDGWPPITGDDVLDVHEILDEFDGDLDDLFSA